jgi:RNA recognition motif-containing protein
MDLEILFRKYGPIKSCVIKRDPQGNSMGFGFINFFKSEDAAKALSDFELQRA